MKDDLTVAFLKLLFESFLELPVNPIEVHQGSNVVPVTAVTQRGVRTRHVTDIEQNKLT